MSEPSSLPVQLAIKAKALTADMTKRLLRVPDVADYEAAFRPLITTETHTVALLPALMRVLENPEIVKRISESGLTIDMKALSNLVVSGLQGPAILKPTQTARNVECLRVAIHLQDLGIITSADVPRVAGEMFSKLFPMEYEELQAAGTKEKEKP